MEAQATIQPQPQTHKPKLVIKWIERNYSLFREFALKNLAIPEPDREDAVQDMMVKMMHCPSFETFMQRGDNPAYSNILRFARREYRSTVFKRGQDASCRSHGARTKYEIDAGQEFAIHHDTATPAVIVYEDDKPSGYDYVDGTQPDPLDELEVQEAREWIVRGVMREWENEAPRTTRLAILDLLMEGYDRKDLEKAFGIGPTRTKVLRAQVQEVARHSLNVLSRQQYRKPRTPKQRNAAARTIKEITSSDIPQYDKLGDILPALQYLTGDLTDCPYAHLSERHRQYLFHSLRMFGLVADGSRDVTERGRAVSAEYDGSRKTRNKIIIELIQSTAVGRTWMMYCGVKSFRWVTAETAQGFLEQYTNLAPSTLKRRVRCLKRWANFIRIGQ